MRTSPTTSTSGFGGPWLAVHPDLFATVATPKADELIAAPHRHGGSMAEATKYFVEGFTDTFHSLSGGDRDPACRCSSCTPTAKRSRTATGWPSSTAWDAMLSAIMAAGLRIVGTWPIHATTTSRQIGQGTNSLASYMVLVCQAAGGRGEADGPPRLRRRAACRVAAGDPQAAGGGHLHRRPGPGGDRAGDGGVLPILPRDRAVRCLHDRGRGAGPHQPGVGRGARRVRRRPRQGNPMGDDVVQGPRLRAGHLRRRREALQAHRHVAGGADPCGDRHRRQRARSS